MKYTQSGETKQWQHSEERKRLLNGITLAVLQAAADGATDAMVINRTRRALLLAEQRRRKGEPIWVESFEDEADA